MKKLFVALLIISLFAQCTTATKIQLVGPEFFTLEAGDSFNDPGIATPDHVKIPAVVSSDLNIHQPGDYEVRYTQLENGKTASRLTRIVHVVDTTAPIITLNGEQTVDVCPNKSYADVGATAYDKVDGDLSDKIKFEASGDRILYMVTDSAGNSSSTTRLLRFRDIQAPRITSSSEISILEGKPLPQLSADDHCEGDVSHRIIAKNSIDTKKPGDYSLHYEVADAAGNTSEFTQIVHVLMARKASTIYLTFDDGPSNLTNAFLDILMEFNVKATFFVNNREGYDAVVKRAFAEGHSIGMHSSTHNYRNVYATEASFYADLYANQAWIKSLIGIAPNIYRFPGGSSNVSSNFNPGIMTTLTKSILNKGIQYFDWNVSAGDGVIHPSDFYVANVKRQLGTNANYIVLMHDGAGHKETLGALREILTYATGLGYTFKPLSYSSPAFHHGVKN
jgi:peptidoglycan/xylan/chitin deacetylase (PgdA/CDA1 family)